MVQSTTPFTLDIVIIYLGSRVALTFTYCTLFISYASQGTCYKLFDIRNNSFNLKIIETCNSKLWLTRVIGKNVVVLFFLWMHVKPFTHCHIRD